MGTFAFDHIHLRSPNPEETAAYFERMFDAEIIRTMQEGKPRIDMKIGGQNVFIADVGPNSGVNAAPVTPYQGLDHFGLKVSNIEKVVADLKAKGAEFTMELEFAAPRHPDLLRARPAGHLDRGAGAQVRQTALKINKS